MAVVAIAASVAAGQQASKLDSDVEQLHYEELEHDLSAVPAGAERDLFAGVLANRTGHIADSIRLLESAVPVAEANSPKRASIGLESLADDYVKTFRYRDASAAYTELISRYADQIPSVELEDVADDAATLKLLVDAPAQTVAWDGPVRLRTHRSPLGSFDVDLTVSGVKAGWLLDTGANFSVLSASFAKRLRVKASAGTAQTKGSSGAENPLHTGIVPEMRIGGAVVRNAVVLIMPDENLRIPTSAKDVYQIEAILGYPVFQALGEITFTADGRLLAGNDAAGKGEFSRLFMLKLTPLLACGTHGHDRLFAFDTGASMSTFFLPYYHEFRDDFAQMKLKRINIAGAGGHKELRAYILKTLVLTVAGRQIALHDVAVYPTPLGQESDNEYGNLGRDLIAPFSSFTLDLTNMRFYLGPLQKQ